jgi:hypothetical protein
MVKLGNKELRKLQRALDHFFTPKAWTVPQSIEDFRILDLLSRQLQLSNHRVILMTDEGLSGLRTMSDVIYDGKVFGEQAVYSDVSGTCKKILEGLLSDGLRPDDAQEFIALIKELLEKEIALRTFAVPVFGVTLVGINELNIGSMKIVPANVALLDAEGVTHDFMDVSELIRNTHVDYWLVGSIRGTPSAAEEKFRLRATLTGGMLAACAASIYQYGATRFRIGVVMSAVDAYGPSSWLSWNENSKSLSVHRNFVSSQEFKIDADLADQLERTGVVALAFELFDRKANNSLEEALIKAVYWYSDAHRETTPVMKLVKYWSCVETFFSSDNKDITRAVSSGLACVLVFGGFNFVPRSEYVATKKRITKLYNLRSRALHGASHQHVAEGDAATLSQWVAWMLVGILAFMEHGYTEVQQIKRVCERLDARATLRTPENGALG